MTWHAVASALNPLQTAAALPARRAAAPRPWAQWVGWPERSAGPRGCTMSVSVTSLGASDFSLGSEAAPDAVAPMDDTGDSPKNADDAPLPATKRFGGPAFLLSVRGAPRPATPQHPTPPGPSPAAAVCATPVGFAAPCCAGAGSASGPGAGQQPV